MVINWYGQFCFKISSNQGKNGNANIVIDPFSKDIGLNLPKLEADILLFSHEQPSHDNFKTIKGTPFLIKSPGEYEIKNVYIQGIPCFNNSSSVKEKNIGTIYVLEAEELNICHLGNFHQKELVPEQIDKIGQIDILMIPIGGGDAISAKEAIKIMSQIEPSIIIPMYYHLPRLKVKLDGLDKFLKTMGIKKIDSLPKLNIKKKDILPEEAKIIVLNP